MEPYFDHEKLRVYQESLKFAEWNEQILKKLPKKLSVWSQLDAAFFNNPPFSGNTGQGR